MADDKQTVRRHFEEVWSKGKVDAMDGIYDTHYAGEVPLVGTVDRDGLRAVIGAYRRAFPDLRFEVQELVGEGDRIAVRWRASGTSTGDFMGIPATGKVGSVDGLSFIWMKNGKIARDEAQMDIPAFLAQMGLELPVKRSITREEEAHP